MSQHTPGPWRFDPNNCGTAHNRGYYGIVADGVEPAAVWMQDAGEANACLIAAAPDLYRLMVSCAVRLDPSDPARIEAVELLKRIDGEQP